MAVASICSPMEVARRAATWTMACTDVVASISRVAAIASRKRRTPRRVASSGIGNSACHGGVGNLRKRLVQWSRIVASAVRTARHAASSTAATSSGKYRTASGTGSANTPAIVVLSNLRSVEESRAPSSRATAMRCSRTQPIPLYRFRETRIVPRHGAERRPATVPTGLPDSGPPESPRPGTADRAPRPARQQVRAGQAPAPHPRDGHPPRQTKPPHPRGSCLESCGIVRPTAPAQARRRSSADEDPLRLRLRRSPPR